MAAGTNASSAKLAGANTQEVAAAFYERRDTSRPAQAGLPAAAPAEQQQSSRVAAEQQQNRFLSSVRKRRGPWWGCSETALQQSLQTTR